MPSELGVLHGQSLIFLKLFGNVCICKIGSLQKCQIGIFCRSKDMSRQIFEVTFECGVLSKGDKLSPNFDVLSFLNEFW